MSNIDNPSTESPVEVLERLGTDGARWAQEFFKALYDAPVTETPISFEPGGIVHGWFANAIEAGRIAGAADEAHTHAVERGLRAAGALPETLLSRYEEYDLLEQVIRDAAYRLATTPLDLADRLRRQIASRA